MDSSSLVNYRVFRRGPDRTEEDMAERILYRPSEAADAIGVSRARAYELIAAGVIPSIRIGTSIRVPVDALKTWIAKQLQEQAERKGL